MPFITEELWQNLSERREGETIMLERMPQSGGYDSTVIADFSLATSTIASLRNVRQSKGISPKEKINLVICGEFPKSMLCVLTKMSNLGEISFTASLDNREAGVSFLAGTVQMFVPLQGLLNLEEEISKVESEIDRYEKFLKGVEAKLSNEKFVNNAPEAVVKTELKKKSDATAKLESLRTTLAQLKKQ